jgi:membrane associated rhomboid family serine protease
VSIYDRDYIRRPQQSSAFSKLPQTVVGWLIVANFAVFIADLFTPETRGGHWLSDCLAVHVYTLARPWYWWQFLTAGFTHSPLDFWHILGNMFALFIFGRDIEYRYGSKEFLRIYLATLIVANVAWAVIGNLTNLGSGVYGASGAIAGIVVLYAFNFPRQMFLLFFVIPVPAWLLGVLLVGMDMLGALGARPGSNVAYPVHLAGAAFALAYYQLHWNLTSFFDIFSRPAAWLSSLARGKPRLHVHRPDRDSSEPPQPRQESPSELSREVDRILEKIYRDGEASLTPQERQTLETASREYQKRRD